MSSGGAGKGSSRSSTQVQIPGFLQPLLNQAAGTGQGALGNLSQLLSGNNLVAPFSSAQETAQNLGIEEALSGESFQTAENTLLGAAQGTSIDQFLPQSAIDALTGAAGGQDLSSFLSPEVLQALTGAAGGDILGRSQLEGIQSGIPQESIDALTSTARGDFLSGGQGFDAAVEAAVRAARPGIISTFGRAGGGGATGGLSRTAIGTAGIDAFARQFGQERTNQLGAANSLAGLTFADRDQQRQIANSLTGINQLGLGAAGVLGGFGGDERNRGLSSAGLLGQFGNAERDRAIGAAQLLPDAATADINLLSGIGGQQQAQAQAQIDAPILAQLQLLAAALGGLPIESLLGSNSRGRASQSFVGFGG